MSHSTPIDRTTAVLSIRPVYAEKILAGTKKVEFRRKPLPESVSRVLIWQTGKDGGIVGHFVVDGQRNGSLQYWRSRFTAAEAGIEFINLAIYAGGVSGFVYGIDVGAPTRLQRTHRLGWDRGPQSFRYAPADWRIQLEPIW